MQNKVKLIFLVVIFLATPFLVGAQTVGQKINFFIDPSYDLQDREELTATLVKITDQLYFYADSNWWQDFTHSEKQSLDVAFYNLATEFEKEIYPDLTSTFGHEPKPGIDKDERITILIHPMQEEARGYFNSGDVYSKLQNPRSNEREMVYLNSQRIDKPEAKSLLAHEFVHLITANQKDLLRKVTEETWLNEARAEYAPTLLGYDKVYKGSNLEKRVKAFLENPSDSLTEWLNKSSDYGIVNLFTQYLVDHYGVKILVDSLQSNKVGIESINQFLVENNYAKDFSQVFTDWAITVLVNDCSLGKEYCYLNKHLQDLRVTPTLYYLPKAETILSTYHTTVDWAANWHKIIGGAGDLIFEFDGPDFVEFNVPYLLCDFNNNCQVEFFILDEKQRGEITVSDFATRYYSLTLIPFSQYKISGFNGLETVFSFSWKVSVKQESEAERIQQLLARIEQLKRQIAEVQAEINAILSQRGQIACGRFERNLYFGMTNNFEVRCLQEFLKDQGSDIYPEGLVTGNFLNLTQAAVIRFQEKYSSEILTPWNLEKGTGFVGETTRAKINQLLGY